VTVRDYEGNVINDEYGPAGPFEDSRKEAGKLIWYRPHDRMHKKYTLGDELKSNFLMKRPDDFDINLYDNKNAYYFQRVKRGIFLPRCIREQLLTNIYLQHDWLRCPKTDQEPVKEDFYNMLGIEKG